MKTKRFYFLFIQTIALVIISSLVAPIPGAYSKTTVTRVSECEREVSNKIEIWSDPDPEIFTAAELAGMTPLERGFYKYTKGNHIGYGEAKMNEIAQEWQSQVTDHWNGPTMEQMQNAAEDLGLSYDDVRQAISSRDKHGNTQDISNPLRDRIVNRAKEMIAAAGGKNNCSNVNCCEICFKTDVKVRKKTDPPTPGYHQVEVCKPGTRSGIFPVDGNDITKNQQGTTGFCGYSPGNAWDSSIAHETGHLMGIDDSYLESGGFKDGHDFDIMNSSYGFPHEDAVRQVLQNAGLDCNCCPTTADGFYQDYGITALAVGDAILGNHCDRMRRLLTRLQHQLADFELAHNISVTAKIDLPQKIRSQIKRLQDALKDCHEPTDGYIGWDNSVLCTFLDGLFYPVPLTPSTPQEPDGEDPRDTPGPEEPGQTDTPGAIDGGETPSGPVVVAGPKISLEPGGDEPRDVDTPEDGGQTDTPGTTPEDEDDDDDNEEVTVTVYVKASQTVMDSSGTQAIEAASGTQVKFFTDDTTDVALPGDGVNRSQSGYDQDPIQGVTDDQGQVALEVPISAVDNPEAVDGLGLAINSTAAGGKNIQVKGTTPKTIVNTFPEGLKKYIKDTTVINGFTFVTIGYPKHLEGTIQGLINSIPGVISSETNWCDTIQEITDPLYLGKGAWKQKYDNQWAIKRVGFTNDKNSAWEKAGKNLSDVIVAVIDTGLDWNHLDLDWDNIWINKDEIPDNNKDDDNNGFVDDIIGWNFYGRNNKPWDHNGHGTIVAGIIAAAQNNGTGIAGINPKAKIMVLKAINNFGHARKSYLSRAIIYAADNGADIINMSVGGKHLSIMEKEAVKYAVSKGVLIVIAAGNYGTDIKEFGLANHPDVITVASTDFKDKRAAFSNCGKQVDIAAPGMDVLSLRARYTDAMRDIPDVKYVNGANYVGKDKRYYRASGTSFSAPIVAGTASLIYSKHPDWSMKQIRQVLLQSADDIEIPGIDQYTGYGLLNAAAALTADPQFFIFGSIKGVKVIKTKKGPALQVTGTAIANQFKKAWLEIGAGESPTEWKRVADPVTKEIKDSVLGEIGAGQFKGAKLWYIKLIVEHKNGKKRETWFRLSLG